MLTMLRSPRTTQAINQAHHIYLGLLPSAATFTVTALYGIPEWLRPWAFFIGLGAVATYLLFAGMFVKTPQSPGMAIFMLLDGPVVAIVTAPGQLLSPGAIIQGFLIDVVGLWIALGWLALTKEDSSSEAWFMRLVLVGMGVASIWTQLELMRPYLLAAYGGWSIEAGWLLIGMLEALFFYHRNLHPLVHDPRLARPEEPNERFFIGMLVLWVAALIGGSLVHYLG